MATKRAGDGRKRARRIPKRAPASSGTIPRSPAARAHAAAEALAQAAGDAGADGWDGHDAVALAPAAVGHARRLLDAWSRTDFAMPDVMADPDGAVLLEWHASPQWVLTIAVDRAGVIHFAGLFDDSRVHGRAPLREAIPDDVGHALTRFHAGRDSHAA